MPGSPSNLQVWSAGREIHCPRFISFAEYTLPPGPEMVVFSYFDRRLPRGYLGDNPACRGIKAILEDSEKLIDSELTKKMLGSVGNCRYRVKNIVHSEHCSYSTAFLFVYIYIYNKRSPPSLDHHHLPE